ncbi:Fe3+/spermidine/putrescine ABC transporter ATP-binding protein [Rhodobacter xanthinilyticus]|uniref:Fe3+/spermidine/putrescine ABC transporter ATP-binding protein n=1 Tax=Rhodobacter xanthinilyticus TaxID=1850250 RepID=A0A1D9MDQ5_9RHOB|nr:ABC transporter ATP-binding protein [Rhodobacter xanthinilyticus]AOZ69997.1 Fe3+/spermidine/putrescine ABC transporter ATP-binding protein [Rhodobacter xanthinilyticus]
MVATPIVTLSGVTKNFGTFKALHETDFEIGEGEFVTLLGPSGCGKTTTLRLIGGFELPSSGRIEIAGQDVTKNPPYRRPVNTVFQDYALFPHMTVAENVAYGLTTGGARPDRGDLGRQVGEVLEMVGLAQAGMKRPGALSGGQRQRVAMARALIRRPRVLLLDEPLSALDVKLRETMQVELKRLHRELGITFLMVTHDQTEALALSDRIVVMQQGRICQIGSPGALYDRPATPYVADFIGAANLIEAEFKGLEGGLERLTLQGGTEITRRPGGAGSPGPFRSGQRVRIGLRPERLRPEIETNRFTGQIVETLFHGDRIRIEFTFAGNPTPAFVELGRAMADRMGTLAPGAPITLGVDPAEVMLFAEEASA